MSTGDRLLALFVALLWGLNFPATEIGLEHFPPILMNSLRWTLLAIPPLLFVPRPQVRLRWLCGAGLGIGVLQFGFVYVGMAAGIPSGLAGLLLQSSAPFTMLLAGVFLREKISRRQVVGIGVAVLGLAAIIAFQAQAVAVLPVILILAGGLGWAIGNICVRQARAPKPLHRTMWMSLFPPIPMFLLSLLFEGPGRIARMFTTLTSWSAWVPAFALLYIVIFAGLVTYGLWNALLARNPSSQVAPYSMMMPAFGVAASWIILGESMTVVQIIAGVVVIAGVLYASRPSKKHLAEVTDIRPKEMAEEI